MISRNREGAMYTADQRAEIITIQQTVIPQMTELGIPISPRNYTVWYEYVQGKDEELNAVIDVMVRRNDEFTEETMDMLYSQFCTDDLNGEGLEELRKELLEQVAILQNTISEQSGESTTLNESLSNSAEMMNNVDSVSEIKEIISKAVSETNKFVEKNIAVVHKFDDIKKEMEEMKKSLATLEDEIRRDELTGIANRKALDEELEKLYYKAKREKGTFSILVVDIDHFKKVNDTYGHLIGDEVLKYIALRLVEKIGTAGFVARFGGEEFTALLPDISQGDAAAIARLLCSYFSQTNLTRKTEPKKIGCVTISIGVAEIADGETTKQLLSRADAALYEAKSNGRNQFRVG